MSSPVDSVCTPMLTPVCTETDELPLIIGYRLDKSGIAADVVFRVAGTANDFLLGKRAKRIPLDDGFGVTLLSCIPQELCFEVVVASTPVDDNAGRTDGGDNGITDQPHGEFSVFYGDDKVERAVIYWNSTETVYVGTCPRT